MTDPVVLSESARDLLDRLLGKSLQYPAEVSADWILAAVSIERDELDQLLDDLRPLIETPTAA